MRLHFLIPGELETLSGGYTYDRRIIAGLQNLGWAVEVHRLRDSFPVPDAGALAHAASVLAAIPTGETALIDGLALGAMPDQAGREAARLKLIALVHHPLAAETGLDPVTAARLAVSEHEALKFVRRVVVTSQATAEKLGEYGVTRDRVVVVEPGTEPAPVARGSRSDKVHLLSVASFIPRKGFEILIEALACTARTDWTLTCIGSLTRDPDTVARVRSLITRHHLDDRVMLVDEVEQSGLDAYYDGADVFVLPTLYEGFGMVVTEALARGLPVVASSTGAITELLSGGGCAPGLLVPPGNVQALEQALSQIIGDARSRQRLAEGARLLRQRLPTWDDACARMADALSL